MKILQINKYYFPKGGADRYMLDLSDLLMSHGHEVIPFSMHHKSNLPSEYADYFVSSVETDRVHFDMAGIQVFSRMFYSREAHQKLRKLIRKTRPDVAHIHNIYTQIPPTILDILKKEGIPVVMTIHDYHMIAPNYMMRFSEENKNLADKSLWWLTANRFHMNSYAASFAQALAFKFHRGRKSYKLGVDAFICPSDFVKAEHIKAGFKKEQMTVIPHFTKRLEEVPKYHDDGYVLYFGRLAKEKGVETLLKAMQIIPDVPCKVVGTGPQSHDLQIEADKLSNVIFEGYKQGEGLWDLVRRARVIVVPSEFYEIFGLVAIEAAALGKPVVASNIGALKDVIADRKTGLLVQPGNAHEFSQAIKRFVDDEALAVSFGKTARARAEKRYNADTHYKAIMKIYESLL